MRLAKELCQHLHVRHRHAKRLGRVDGEFHQVVAVVLSAVIFQPRERGLDLLLERNQHLLASHAKSLNACA